MTIKEYIKTHKDWCILEECELDFSDPNNVTEAIENIKWAIKKFSNKLDMVFEALRIIVRSYYANINIWG